MAYPTLMRCLWSSTPVIAGIWASVIKQAVSTRRGDARKSAVEEKASTAKPKDLISLRTDSRMNRSFSTTETNDAFVIGPRSSHVPAMTVLQQCRRARTESCACPHSLDGVYPDGSWFRRRTRLVAATRRRPSRGGPGIVIRCPLLGVTGQSKADEV